MISREQENQIISRSAAIGLSVIMSVNLACLVIGHFIAGEIAAGPPLEFIAPLLYALALADIGAGFIIKKTMLKPLYTPGTTGDSESIGKVITKAAIVLAALSAVTPLYGLLLIFLGGKFNYLIGFVIISLGGFTILRPRLRDLEGIRRI